MKIKGVFKVFLSCCISMTLLFSTACGDIEYYWGKPEVEWFKSSNGEVVVVYNGSHYVRNENIIEDSFQGEYFSNFEEREVVAAFVSYMVIFGRLPMYISTMDSENVVLQIQGIGAMSYYVKEGFELPNIENTKISRIFLQKGSYDAEYSTCCREYIDAYEGGLTLYEIVEENASMLEGEFVGTCYLELEGYEYLKVGQFSVREEENQLYFCIGENRKKTEEGYLCYKIKDEYQEVFRDAINELNNT